jgi:hypothetical protein
MVYSSLSEKRKTGMGMRYRVTTLLLMLCTLWTNARGTPVIPVFKAPDILWTRPIADFDTGFAQIRITEVIGLSGKILCAGSARKTGDTSFHAYFALLDSAGKLIRSSAFGKGPGESVSALYSLGGGAFLAAAAISSADSDSSLPQPVGLWVMKLDMDLEIVMDTTYFRKRNEIPTSIARIGSSQFAVGTSNSLFLLDSSLSVVRDTAIGPISDVAGQPDGTISATGIAPVPYPFNTSGGKNGPWLYWSYRPIFEPVKLLA